ncbi:putative ribonuclease H-like domain-containing protein [Tanacetum coccineum]|uniref:Ribonuclease H-like domain-containing protein n=1 Tax=Tanacetum coccineum TaxID=301880 RepID=A0ABQ5BV11_9ASTR
MKAVKEKEQLQKTVDSWKDSSKNLWRLINSGMSSNDKLGLGFEIQSNDEVSLPSFKWRFILLNHRGNEIDDSLYVYGKKGPQKPEISVSDDNSSEHSTCQSNDSEGSCGNTSEHSFETESESVSEPSEMSKSRLEVTNEKDVSAPNSKELTTEGSSEDTISAKYFNKTPELHCFEEKDGKARAYCYRGDLDRTSKEIKDSSIDSLEDNLKIHAFSKRAKGLRTNLELIALLCNIKKQQRNNHKDQQHCLFACFLSQEEPKKIAEALQDDSWVQAMQEELLQFKLQQVWVLVDLPHGMKVIGTKWVYRNKRDERGVVVRNKARLVAQGYTQEEGIDYDEVFAPFLCGK